MITSNKEDLIETSYQYNIPLDYCEVENIVQYPIEVDINIKNKTIFYNNINLSVYDGTLYQIGNKNSIISTRIIPLLKLKCYYMEYFQDGFLIYTHKLKDKFEVRDFSDVIDISSYYEREGLMEDFYNEYVEVFQGEMLGLFEDYLNKLFIVDAMLHNCDRHIKNIIYLYDREYNKAVIAPIHDFDNCIFDEDGNIIDYVFDSCFDFTEYLDVEEFKMYQNRLLKTTDLELRSIIERLLNE